MITRTNPDFQVPMAERGHIIYDDLCEAAM